MLTLTDVTTHYGNSQALFGMSFDIQPGQVVTLLGRNGMGKTTTINSIMGIVPASGGSVTFEGQELLGQKRRLLITARNQHQAMVQDCCTSASIPWHTSQRHDMATPC